MAQEHDPQGVKLTTEKLRNPAESKFLAQSGRPVRRGANAPQTFAVEQPRAQQAETNAAIGQQEERSL